MHPLGERTIVRRHVRDPVEDILQAVGLLGAFLAFGSQLGGALLHRGTLLGAETVGLGHGILRGHSRASLLDAQGLGVIPASVERLGPTTPWRFSMLNCLTAAVPARERVISCEEVFEFTILLCAGVA